MALDRLTKVDGGGISTTSDYRVGIITATKFVGPIEGDVTGSITATDGTFSGNVTIGGTLSYEDVTNIDSVGIITARNGIHVGAGVSAVGVGTFSGVDITGGTLERSSTGNKLIFNSSTETRINHSTGNKVVLSFHNNSGFRGSLDAHNGAIVLYNGGNKASAVFRTQGATELYYDHVGTATKRLETSNTGVTVTGTVVATGADINGDLDVDGHTNLDNVSIAGVATFSQGGSEVVRINSAGLLVYNDVAFFGASTHAYWDHSSSKFILNDNTKLTLGSSSDYEVYHDGSNAVHRVTGDGDLKLLVEEKNFIVQGTGGHQIIKGIDNGAVELYYDNTLRLETRTNDVKFHGGLVAVDNVKLQLGSSGDLQLFHDGSNSYVSDPIGIGNLRIRVNTGQVELQPKIGEYGLICKPAGAVELYHNNSKKFQTQAFGAKIFNTAGSGGTRLEIQGQEGNPAILQLNADDGDDNADYSQIYHGTDGAVLFRNFTSGSWETNIKTIGNGAVELYYNNGLQFETLSNGVKPTNNLFMNDGKPIYLGNHLDLNIRHDGNNSIISHSGTGDLLINTADGEKIYVDTSEIVFRNAASNETLIKATQNGAVELYYDNSRKLFTDDDGVTIGGPDYEQLKIDGQVGDCILKSSGAEIEFTRGASSNILCSNSSGRLDIYTGGQTTYPAMRIFASTGHTASGAKVGINTDAIGVDTVMSVMAQPGQPALYSSYGMRIMPNGANSFGYAGQYITRSSGVYVIHMTIPANNTWTQVAAGRYHGATVTARIGDASSKRTIFANYDFTAPNYGVASFNEIANTGGWNTGSASMRIANASTNDYAIEVQHNSYYNTSNNSSVHLIFNVC